MVEHGNGRAEAQLGYVPEKTAAEILLQFGLVAPHYAFPRAQTTAGHRIYPKIRFDVWAGDFPKG